MLKLLIGLYYINSGNVVEIISVRSEDPPVVTVRLVKVPDDGAFADEGTEWDADWSEFTAGWNPLD